MSLPIDFEAEARAVTGSIDAIIAKLQSTDARARSEGQADGYRRGVEAAIAPLRGMKTNERAGYMAAIPQTKELCAYTALILLECMGRIRALLPPEPAKGVDDRDEVCCKLHASEPVCPIHGARR